MLPSAITTIEKGQRGVDVDDLVALAVALGVTPNRLLLLDEKQAVEAQGDVWMRPTTRRFFGEVWKWACGE